MKWYEVESKTGCGEWENWVGTGESVLAESEEEAIEIYKAWMQDCFVQSLDRCGKGDEADTALNKLWQETEFRIV